MEIEKKEVEHIKQNDPRCYKIIQQIGCFFRSCLLVAEYKTGLNFTADQINFLWCYSKEHSWIDTDNNVRNSASIINKALRELGNCGTFYEVGTFSAGYANYYPSVKNEWRTPDALIQKIKQNGKSIYHFRVVDKLGNLIEDPHAPVIKVKSIEYSILYHYVGENDE